jgi:hypothetical protein
MEDIQSYTDSDILPSLYTSWMQDVLNGPLPTEREATCNDCAMCPQPGQPEAQTKNLFNPKIKCCTYIPEVYNFLAGSVLLQEEPSSAPGRDALLNRIHGKVDITPLGIGRGKVFSLLYQYSAKSFGHSETLRCPYYVDAGGLCGIWNHRNSICSTWFCKHERGVPGHYFWKCLQQLLGEVEKGLSNWCVVQAGFNPEALREIFPFPIIAGSEPQGSTLDPVDLEESHDAKKYQLLWGNQLGHEEEFYRNCAKWVNSLEWDQVMKICGPAVEVYANLLRSAYNRLQSDDLPPRLKTGQLKIHEVNEQSVLVVTYSNYDPLSIPPVLMDLLQYFNGQAVEEVIKRIAEQRQIEIGLDLLRKLVDYEVLIPV